MYSTLIIIGVLIVSVTPSQSSPHRNCLTPPTITQGKLGFCEGTSAFTCGVHCNDGSTHSVACSESGEWTSTEGLCALTTPLSQPSENLMKAVAKISPHKDRLMEAQQLESEECTNPTHALDLQAFTDAQQLDAFGVPSIFRAPSAAVDGVLSTFYSSGPLSDHPDTPNPSLWVVFENDDVKLCSLSIAFNDAMDNQPADTEITVSIFSGEGDPAVGTGYYALQKFSYADIRQNGHELSFSPLAAYGRGIKITTSHNVLIVNEVFNIQREPTALGNRCQLFAPIMAWANVIKGASRNPLLAIDGNLNTLYSSGTRFDNPEFFANPNNKPAFWFQFAAADTPFCSAVLLLDRQHIGAKDITFTFSMLSGTTGNPATGNGYVQFASVTRGEILTDRDLQLLITPSTPISGRAIRVDVNSEYLVIREVLSIRAENLILQPPNTCEQLPPAFAWANARRPHADEQGKLAPRGDVQHAIDGDFNTAFSSGRTEKEDGIHQPEIWWAFSSEDRELCSVEIQLDRDLYANRPPKAGAKFSLSAFAGPGDPSKGEGYFAVDSQYFEGVMTLNELRLVFDGKGIPARALKLTVNWRSLVISEVLPVRVGQETPTPITWQCQVTRPILASALTSKAARVPQLAIDGDDQTTYSSGVTTKGENNLRVLLAKQTLDWCSIDVLMGDNEINAKGNAKAIGISTNSDGGSDWGNDEKFNFHSGFVFLGGVTPQSQTAQFTDLDNTAAVRLDTDSTHLIVSEVTPTVAYNFNACQQAFIPAFTNTNANKMLDGTNTPNPDRLPTAAFDGNFGTYYSSGLDVENPAMWFQVTPSTFSGIGPPIVVCDMSITLGQGFLGDERRKFTISVASAVNSIDESNARNGFNYQDMHEISFIPPMTQNDLTIRLTGVVWPTVTHVKITADRNKLLISEISWSFDTTGHKRPITESQQGLSRQQIVQAKMDLRRAKTLEAIRTAERTYNSSIGNSDKSQDSSSIFTSLKDTLNKTTPPTPKMRVIIALTSAATLVALSVLFLFSRNAFSRHSEITAFSDSEGSDRDSTDGNSKGQLLTYEITNESSQNIVNPLSTKPQPPIRTEATAISFWPTAPTVQEQPHPITANPVEEEFAPKQIVEI